MAKRCETCKYGEVVYKNVDYVTTPGGYRDTICRHPDNHTYCTAQSRGADAVNKYEDEETTDYTNAMEGRCHGNCWGV